MSYTHLTEKDRYVISHLKLAKLSYREIGRRLGRSHTSISRGIKRNGPQYEGDVYWYYVTQPVALKRKHEARVYRRQDHKPLVAYVEDKLRLSWPPEAISARLKIDFPDDPKMRICHETIYRWIYLDARQGGDLHEHSRRRHKRRRRQTRYGSGRRFLPGRVSIHDRPAIASSRERFGDWEGDTLEGGKGCGHLATLVERKSRYLLAARLSDKKAETMTEASIKAFWRMPSRPLKNIATTDDRHLREFAEHQLS